MPFYEKSSLSILSIIIYKNTNNHVNVEYNRHFKSKIFHRHKTLNNSITWTDPILCHIICLFKIKRMRKLKLSNNKTDKQTTIHT